MRKLTAILQLLVLPVCSLAQTEPPTFGSEGPIQGHLRARLEHLSPERRLVVGGEPVHASTVLPACYERQLYHPAWTSAAGVSAAGMELMSAIRESSSHGLDPSHYHLVGIEELMARAEERPTSAFLADLDLLLTDAFLVLGAHLVSGRVDPETFDAEWIAYRREVDLARALEEAIAGGKPRDVLAELLPRHSGYARLRSALGRYRELATSGGWSTIDPGANLHPGDTDARVASLRRRLERIDPEMPASEGDGLIYDEGLAAAARRFQALHGLEPDGVIGEKTLAALNTSAQARVRQIELNLERWRWLPQNLGTRFVLVNIPEFSLVVVDEEKTILEMRVAVGRRYRRTPVFSDVMRYLVINPSWAVPHKLAVQDKLPEIQKDPDYLAKLGFRVYKGWGADQVLIDPATVDWPQLSPARFPYHLRQDPGPLNALGRVKFMFPNRFDVYLHDTPTRMDFLKSERDVSSGCVRLEKPLELAELLLVPSSKWTRAAVEKAIATGSETTVTLDRPVPVHILYWTAWSDETGAVHFRRDLYGRDDLLAAALVQAGQSAHRSDGDS